MKFVYKRHIFFWGILTSPILRKIHAWPSSPDQLLPCFSACCLLPDGLRSANQSVGSCPSSLIWQQHLTELITPSSLKHFLPLTFRSPGYGRVIPAQPFIPLFTAASHFQSNREFQRSPPFIELQMPFSSPVLNMCRCYIFRPGPFLEFQTSISSCFLGISSRVFWNRHFKHSVSKTELLICHKPAPHSFAYLSQREHQFVVGTSTVIECTALSAFSNNNNKS